MDARIIAQVVCDNSSVQSAVMSAIIEAKEADMRSKQDETRISDSVREPDQDEHKCIVEHEVADTANTYKNVPKFRTTKSVNDPVSESGCGAPVVT